MATPNVGILTNVGKNLIDQVNAGKTKITFSKIVFSSMDNSQLSDMQVKALTAIAPQEVVVSSPETTLDTNSGETRIRATGTNEKLADGVYVKTYGVFAKDDTGSEILYGVTVSPNPNYFPAYDGVTPQAVTYSYKTVIQETSNITMTNSNDVYASQEDLTEALQPYAKTVDVNQQLDNKVNVADMRKPASDVAGIEEVNAKQDKIGYTPADDSKVVHNSAIDPSVVVKHILTADDDVLALDPGTYYTWFVKPKNYPEGLNQFATVVVRDIGNHQIDERSITITDCNGHQQINNHWGSASTGKWSGWQVPNSDTMATKSDVTTAVSAATATKADDSKVAHLSGANNFDTVPTVNNNPLLLASSLPSDLARTGQVNTFNLTQAFSQGIKTLQTGSYSDANSLVNEGLYFNTNLSIKNGAGSITAGFIQVMSGYWDRVRQFMYSDVTNNLVYTRVSSDSGSTWSNWVQIITSDQIPTDLARTSQQTNFTAGLKSGGVDVATAADLKSIEDSAWRQLDNQYVTISADGSSFQKANDNSIVLYKIDKEKKFIYFSFVIYSHGYTENILLAYIDFSSIVKNISFPSYQRFSLFSIPESSSRSVMSIVNNQIQINGGVSSSLVSSMSAEYHKTSSSVLEYSQCFVYYDELV